MIWHSFKRGLQLKKLRFNFEPNGLEKTIAKVFEGYNIDKSKFDDMHPYHVFAITGNLIYELSNNC